MGGIAFQSTERLNRAKLGDLYRSGSPSTQEISTRRECHPERLRSHAHGAELCSVFAFKNCAPVGMMIQASNPSDLGLVKNTQYFSNVVSNGQPSTRPEQFGFEDIRETYA